MLMKDYGFLADFEVKPSSAFLHLHLGLPLGLNTGIVPNTKNMNEHPSTAPRKPNADSRY
jgi:hypothetical protein